MSKTVLPRKKKGIIVIIFVLLAVIGAMYMCQSDRGISPAEPVSLILDTDFSSDVDDVGAVALLHGLANQGRARILAMLVSSGDPWSVPCLAAINAWFGRPEIPVGAVRGEYVRDESKYTRIIADEFTLGNSGKGQAPDAVQVYRKILSGQPDHSVTLVSVGYLTNLRNLLQSQPDSNSPMSGRELVRAKVVRLVCMGGEYPSGREWNFYRDSQAAAFVVDSWPGSIVFCGFELGRNIMTGSVLRDTGQPNPIRRAYELYNSLTDRPSWDQVTVFYAVETANEKKSQFWLRFFGQNKVQPDGSNIWLNKQRGRIDHAYLVQQSSDSELETRLGRLMRATPQ
jgi:inosine-uridine nucleoside N-ribohydrolase